MTSTAAHGLYPERTLSATANVQALSREVLEATGGVAVSELLLQRLGSLIDAVDLLFLDVQVTTTAGEHRHHEDIEMVAVTADLVAHVHAHVSRSSETQQYVTSEFDVRSTNLIHRLVVDTEDTMPSATHPAFRPGLRSVRLLFSDGHSLSVPVSERGRDRVSTALHAFLPPTRRTT